MIITMNDAEPPGVDCSMQQENEEGFLTSLPVVDLRPKLDPCVLRALPPSFLLPVKAAYSSVAVVQ